MSKFPNEDLTQKFLQEHADQSISELSTTDQMVRKLNDKNGKNKRNKSQNMLSPLALSPKAPSDHTSDSFELQLHLHYLFKHLLLLGRGSN